jgi:hypothetical protein
MKAESMISIAELGALGIGAYLVITNIGKIGNWLNGAVTGQVTAAVNAGGDSIFTAITGKDPNAPVAPNTPAFNIALNSFPVYDANGNLLRYENNTLGTTDASIFQQASQEGLQYDATNKRFFVPSSTGASTGTISAAPFTVMGTAIQGQGPTVVGSSTGIGSLSNVVFSGFA